MKRRILIAVVLASAQPALCLSGTVSGKWTWTDQRDWCCDDDADPTGCQHDTCGDTNDALKFARVKLIGTGGASYGQGTTDINGNFSFSWSDNWCVVSPCGYDLRVYLENVNDFQVQSSGLSVYSFTTSITIPSGSSNVGTKHAGSQERLAVYETANEMWYRIVNNSSVVQSGMGFRYIEFPAGPGSLYNTLGPCGWAGTQDVYVADGDGEGRPFAVAHEIGHCISDVAFNVQWLSLDSAESCNPYHEYDLAHDCEALATNEALADFWSTAWAWDNNATGATWEGFAVEHINASSDCIGTNCATEGCINDPSGDDDALTDADTSIGIATMANVLGQFADNCSYFSDNRCSNEESTQDGRNIWDWLENFDDLLPSESGEALDIIQDIGMDNQCEEVFHP
jgi:hypothetical protein